MELGTNINNSGVVLYIDLGTAETFARFVACLGRARLSHRIGGFSIATRATSACATSILVVLVLLVAA